APAVILGWSNSKFMLASGWTQCSVSIAGSYRDPAIANVYPIQRQSALVQPANGVLQSAHRKGGCPTALLRLEDEMTNLTLVASRQAVLPPAQWAHDIR